MYNMRQEGNQGGGTAPSALAAGSRALVCAQILLPLVMLVRAPWWPVRPAAGVVASVGLFLGVWAVATMRLSQLYMLPDVRPGTRLRTDGPYRMIRHPMYTALLLGGTGLALQRPDAWMGLCWAVLALVLVLKIRREERFLELEFREYVAYRRRTWRMLPWVF